MVRSRTFRRGVLGVILAFTMLSAPGCMDMAQVVAMRDQAARLSQQLESDITQREHTLATLRNADPADPQAAALVNQLTAEVAAARTSKHAIDEGLSRINQVLFEAQNPSDPISAGLGAVAPFLPEPSRTPLILGGALLVTLLRARQMKLALVSVAKGLDKAMSTDDQFKDRFRQHAPLFRTVQTPAARRVIDEATRPGFMLRLPL